MNNTSGKIVLQQGGDLEVIRDHLKLNSKERDLVASLRQVKGSFSEAFLIDGDNRTVIQSWPSPLEYWISTSDGDDKNLLEDQIQKFPQKTLPDHIHALANLYPRGVASGRNPQSLK